MNMSQHRLRKCTMSISRDCKDRTCWHSKPHRWHLYCSNPCNPKARSSIQNGVRGDAWGEAIMGTYYYSDKKTQLRNCDCEYRRKRRDQ